MTQTTCLDKMLWSISDINNIWQLENAVMIAIKTSTGTLRYRLKPGYKTDFRSGPSIVNPLIPKIGNPHVAISWVVHDVNYHGFTSRELADILLRDMLLEAGMSAWKARLTYTAVRWAGGSHYNDLTDDQGLLYNDNRDHYIRFDWSDK